METQTIARQALARHRQHLATLHEQSRALERRIADFRADAARHAPAIAALTAARRERMELLASVAVGEATTDVLDTADTAMLDTEAAARAAERAIEIAEAGAARLIVEHEAVAGKIAAAAQHTAGLVYGAAVELAQSRLPAYRAAAEALGAAHAALMAACLVADDHADVHTTPARVYVRGSALETRFTPLLPALPGIDPKDWSFDTSEQVAAARAAALGELQG